MKNVVAIQAFRDNYIWLIPTENSNVIIVDPGDERPLLQHLRDHRLTPVAIIITHQCHDHVDGISPILEQYSIPVYGPASEAIPGMSHPLKEGDLITFDNALQLRVLDLPGHTAGHVGYYQPTGAGALFCGDTLFGAGCGRLHSGLYDKMFHSLQKIAALPNETQLYCAHEYTQANLNFAIELEPDNRDIQARILRTDALRAQHQPTLPSTLIEEKSTNPFLRCHTPTIMAAAQRYAEENGLPLPIDAAATFRTIRDWKNHF
ncbi:MAG TPA: hydroxyacylglutathione hydrolase [Chromatiales bacterium]|nr:hydroxyacylglutathione hydrolase [Chromatiales bacterium]